MSAQSSGQNKSTMPPPPPFYHLYTMPPPPPPLPSDRQISESQQPIKQEESKENDIAQQSSQPPLSPASLARLLYTPPPPLATPFLKFGELSGQGMGWSATSLGPDIPPLYVTVEDEGRREVEGKEKAKESDGGAEKKDEQHGDVTADSDSKAVASELQSGFDGPPPGRVINYTLSLRILNRQYLQAFIALLSALTTPQPESSPTSSDGAITAAASTSATSNSSSSSPTPGNVEQALHNLLSISLNLSYLLSRLRKHQSMQTLVHLLVRQVEHRRRTLKAVRDEMERTKKWMETHGIMYEEGSKEIVPALFKQMGYDLDDNRHGRTTSTMLSSSAATSTSRSDPTSTDMLVDNEHTGNSAVNSSTPPQPPPAATPPSVSATDAALLAYFDSIIDE